MRLPARPLHRLALMFGVIVALALVISACEPIAASPVPGSNTPATTLAPGASATPAVTAAPSPRRLAP